MPSELGILAVGLDRFNWNRLSLERFDLGRFSLGGLTENINNEKLFHTFVQDTIS